MYKKKIVEKGYFAHLVQHERERSERTNEPFSLICINLLKINGHTNGQHSKSVLNTIASSIRSIDRAGWIKNNTIGIILPHTSTHGAKILVKKIKGKLKASLLDNDSSLDFILSSYPDTFDYIKENTNSKSVNTSTNSKSTFFKMEYSSDPYLSDVINIDSSFIIDLGKIGLRHNWQFIVKRFIDIMGALFGIIIFSPLMLIIAAAIKLTSKGPVLFRQERLGYQGKKFVFLKFRSMHINNDESLHREYVEKLIQGNHKEINLGSKDRPYYKIKNDPRVIPLGRILRKSSLDELPQFFNVLMGQMSLVGPRPPIPYELDSYQNWHMKRILNVKPGITGFWQVKGRSLTTFDEMVRLDLHYSNNWNLWLDFKILFSTFKAVFTGNGAD